MIPSVHLQYPLVVLGKHPVLLALPEDARARPDELVVEHALVERPLPTAPVQGLQPLPALLHAVEPVARLPLSRGHAVFQGGPAPLPVEQLVCLLQGDAVKLCKVILQQDGWLLLHPRASVGAGRP